MIAPTVNILMRSLACGCLFYVAAGVDANDALSKMQSRDRFRCGVHPFTVGEGLAPPEKGKTETCEGHKRENRREAIENRRPRESGRQRKREGAVTNA